MNASTDKILFLLKMLWLPQSAASGECLSITKATQ